MAIVQARLAQAPLDLAHQIAQAQGSSARSVSR
jgi:hypothetical protein